MSFDESLDKPKKDDPILIAAKQRAIDRYRQPFLEQIRDCPCHCHFPVACSCPKDCEHCRPIL